WAGGGMVSAEVEAELARQGLPAMAPELALRGLELALGADRTSLAIVDVDWAHFAPVFAAARPRPLLLGVDAAKAAIAGATGPARDAGTGAFEAQVRALSAAARHAFVAAVVAEETAAVLGIAEPSALPVRQG